MENIEIIISAFALAFSLFTFVWSERIHNRAAERERKQATLDAFNVLQEQVLDELVKYEKEELDEIAKHNRCEKYRVISTLLARCEHFAVGVEQKIYDYDTVYHLAGEHIVRIFKEFLPLIEAKRKYMNRNDRYHAFETLANRLEAQLEKTKQQEGEQHG